MIFKNQILQAITSIILFITSFNGTYKCSADVSVQESIRATLTQEHDSACDELRKLLCISDASWYHLQNKVIIDLENDLALLASPLKPDEAPAFHSTKIPQHIMERIYTVLRHYNINPDRIEIAHKPDNFKRSAESHLRTIKHSGVRSPVFTLLCPLSFMHDMPAQEIEGVIVHELSHIICGHLHMGIALQPHQKQQGISKKHPVYQRFSHAKEFMADQYFAVTNNATAQSIRAFLKRQCTVAPHEMFFDGITHPSDYQRYTRLDEIVRLLKQEAKL